VQLAQLRADLAEATGSYEASLKQNFDRLGEPVERGSSMDNAWLQSYSTALGTAAALQLLSSYRAVGEVIDRKAAYSMAILSLYIALLSLLLSVLFGLPALDEVVAYMRRLF
jgi:hypothetical protein